LTDIIAAKFLYAFSGGERGEGLAGINLTGRRNRLDARRTADIGSDIGGMPGGGIAAGIDRARAGRLRISGANSEDAALAGVFIFRPENG
jgi:hypothetical protein